MENPRLRFLEFKSGEKYNTYLIRDIANISIGRDLREESFSDVKTEEYCYPVFSNTVANRGLYGFYNFQEFQGNSLTVVGRGAGLGTAFSRDAAFGAIGRLLVLSPKDNAFDVDYLSEYINSKLKIYNESGGIPQLPGSTFGGYMVSLPTISEQRKVASFFIALNKKISLLMEKYQLLLSYREGVTKKIFSQEIQFKDIHGNNYPEWEFMSLKAAEEEGHIELGRGSVISKAELAANPGGYPVYSSSVQNEGLFGYWGNFIFDEEMVTWSIDGGGNFFFRDRKKFSITNVSGYMKFKTNKINPYFAYLTLKTQHQKLHFDYQSKAHPSVIRDMYNFSIPCVEEQNKVVAFLSTVDKKIRCVNAQITLTKAYKQGLLQKMFI